MSKIEFINPWAEGNTVYDNWFENSYIANNESSELGLQTAAYTRPKVVNGEWTDSSGNETNLIPFEEKTVGIKLKFNTDAIGKSYNIIVYRYAVLGPQVSLYNSEDFIVDSENVFHEFDLRSFFTVHSSQRQHLYFKIELDGFWNNEYFPKSRSKYLKVHIIRFIPEIMQYEFGWEKAAFFQKKWFGTEAQSDFRENPADLSLTMDWALSFERVQNHYNEIFINEIWKSNEAIDSLIIEVGKMLTATTDEGKINLPTNENKEVMFDAFDTKLVFHKVRDKYQQVPLYHKYYYQRHKFESSELSDPLDDFFGAVANFVFCISPVGFLKYESENNYKIKLTKIAIHLADDFSFNADLQLLGYWDIPNNDVRKHPFGTGVLITDRSYRKWREDHKKGGDFYTFSDYRIENVDLEIDVPIEIGTQWNQ